MRKGQYCWVCNQYRPNEKFSGKGHKKHVCKECSKRPKEQLIEIETNKELVGYWEQKNISKKNIKRIATLSKVSNIVTAELAQVILEVARLYPHRKKRIKNILRNNKELIPRLEKVGLLTNWEFHEADNSYEEMYGYESDDPMNFEYYLHNDENDETT